VQHRLRAEAANEAAVTALHEQQTCERAALEVRCTALLHLRAARLS
jgi:hypothetical protein